MCHMRSVPKPSSPGEFMRDVKNGVELAPNQSFHLRTRTIWRIRPKKNGGMDRPRNESRVDMLSKIEYWRSAEKVPIARPKIMEIPKAKMPSWIVFHMASLRSGHTG